MAESDVDAETHNASETSKAQESSPEQGKKLTRKPVAESQSQEKKNEPRKPRKKRKIKEFNKRIAGEGNKEIVAPMEGLSVISDTVLPAPTESVQTVPPKESILNDSDYYGFIDDMEEKIRKSEESLSRLLTLRSTTHLKKMRHLYDPDILSSSYVLALANPYYEHEVEKNGQKVLKRGGREALEEFIAKNRDGGHIKMDDFEFYVFLKTLGGEKIDQLNAMGFLADWKRRAFIGAGVAGGIGAFFGTNTNGKYATLMESEQPSRPPQMSDMGNHEKSNGTDQSQKIVKDSEHHKAENKESFLTKVMPKISDRQIQSLGLAAISTGLIVMNLPNAPSHYSEKADRIQKGQRQMTQREIKEAQTRIAKQLQGLFATMIEHNYTPPILPSTHAERSNRRNQVVKNLGDEGLY